MNLSNLTFIVTDSCNFNCSYCMQKKENIYINNDIIDEAVDFFYPFFKEDEQVHVGFYGGEPLLAFDQVAHVVRLVNEKNLKGKKDIEFSLTTNGTLLTEEMLDFFEQSGFFLMLSFDGLAQNIGRKKNTMEKMIQATKLIRMHQGIKFEINSVFTPATISYLSGSMRFMIEPAGPDITFSLSSMETWSLTDITLLKKELELLSDYLLLYYQKTGHIPVKNFRTPMLAPITDRGHENGATFQCSAGSQQMAVTTQGDVWGCFMFHDYFKTRKNDARYNDYYFGKLKDFIADYKNRYANKVVNYWELRQDLYQVGKSSCFLCKEVGNCMVCPVNAAYTSGELGKVSCNQCMLNKIQINAQRKFRERAGFEDGVSCKVA